MYTICIKIDKTLPWIEIKGEYATKKEAKGAAVSALRSAQVKIDGWPEKRKPMKALATVRTHR